MPNLATVTLPAGLTSIPKDAFAGSAQLKTVNFGVADTGNGGGSSGPSSRAVTGGVENTITLPKGITSIGNNAFAGTAATTVDLSTITAAGFTAIGENVFKGMTNLETVKLPSGVTSIGNNAFQGDAKLVKLSTEAPATSGGQAREGDDTTATFGSSLTSIGQNAFQGTGFTTVDLSAAKGTSGSTSTTLTVSSGSFTNMANLTTVKLPANADINPTYFGNPVDAETPKLKTIQYGDDKTTTATATATTGNDANISSLNFSKITNPTIEIKSSVGSSTINFTGGVFNGNETMTTLKLSLAANTRNGNNPL